VNILKRLEFTQKSLIVLLGNIFEVRTFCFAALREKSTEAKKHDASSTANVKATSRRTDRVSVLPWSGDGQGHLLSLMLDMTRRVAALQDAVADMRQENKINYRQLKRHMLKLSASSQSNSADRQSNYDSSKPQSFVQTGK